MSEKQEKTAQAGGSDPMVSTFYCYSAPHSVISASLPPSPMNCYQRRKGPGPASLIGVLAPARYE